MGLLSKTLILLNFKVICGADALGLAKQLQQLDDETRESFDIALAVQPQDVPVLSRETDLPLFIQDCGSYGDCHYGDLGARGIILNHPEKKATPSQLDETMAKIGECDLEVMICSTSIDEAARLNEKYNPDYVAIENEALIGKPVSFATFCPELVSDAVARIDNRLLFGGGIKGSDDIRCVVLRGGAGVLISSVVVKSATPLAALKRMLVPIPALV